MTFLQTLQRALQRDPMIWATLLLGGSITLFYLFPLVSPKTLENLAWYAWDALFMVLVLGCCLQGLHQRHKTAGRRFWYVLSAAIASWLAASLATAWLHLMTPYRWINVTVDLLYLGYYVGLILASELRPERNRVLRHLPTENRIDLLAAFGLSFFFLIYFVLIPAHFDLAEHTNLRSSALLYLGLDLVLLGRFATSAYETQDPRWRLTYYCLAAAMLYSAFLLALELVAFFPFLWNPIPEVSGTLWDILWLTLYLPFIAAARLPAQLPLSTTDARTNLRPETTQQVWGPALLYALLLPCVHLILHNLVPLDPEGRQARELLSSASFLFFGSLALVQYRHRETTRAQAQDRLRASQDRYRQLVDHSPEGLLVELDGRIVFANPTAREFFGDERFDSGPSLAELGLPQPSPSHFLELMDPSSPATLPMEHAITTQDGQTLKMEVSFLWIRYQDRLACQAILRDLGAAREQRDRTEDMERMAAIGQFSATIAHEIRNPLASLLFNIRYLGTKIAEDDEQKDYLLKFEKAIDHMQNTVTRVLEFSRFDPALRDGEEKVSTPKQAFSTEFANRGPNS